MKIDKEMLAEKNYSGSRLIEITDKTVLKLQKEVAKFAPLAKPHLDKLEKLGKVLDPARIKIRELREKLKKEEDKIKEDCKFDELVVQEAKAIEELEAINQKADLVKNKITPIINNLVKDQLDEFEIARHVNVKEDKIFVEVFDEVEEKVKQLRAQKANRK